MNPTWIEFDPKADGLPAERRHVLLLLAEQPDKGLPASCAVGYMRIHSHGPFFVIPGIGGKVTHWADCLGDDFKTPILSTKSGQRWQLTNGKWGE